jgi:hypothetical protein
MYHFKHNFTIYYIYNAWCGNSTDQILCSVIPDLCNGQESTDDSTEDPNDDEFNLNDSIVVKDPKDKTDKDQPIDDDSTIRIPMTMNPTSMIRLWL